MPKPSKAEQQAILKRLDTFSRFTDSSVPIPFTSFRIGTEAIIGILPIVGDAVGLLLSSYVLFEAHRAGASRWVKLRILANMSIDFLGGPQYQPQHIGTLVPKNYVNEQTHRNQ